MNGNKWKWNTTTYFNFISSLFQLYFNFISINYKT
jgi:hypothetical protein